MTISERIAAYVVDLRYEDLPPSVVDKAKNLVRHHIGAALRGTGGGASNELGPTGAQRTRQAVQVAFNLSGADGPCTIVGEPRRADLPEAVFANAFLMNGLDDLLPPDADPPFAGAHPGIMVHPVAWAAGEANRASGQQLITAVVAGYDTIGRLGWSMLPWSRAWPRRGLIFGPFGGAATAAKLMGLSHAQTAHALGHAGQAGMGIVEGSEYLWTLKPLLARNGLMAAALAEVGMPASPTVIEGQYGIYRSFFCDDAPESVDQRLAALGQEFDICKAQITRGNGLGSTPVDLVERLVREHSLSLSQIAAVDVFLPREQEPRHTMREHALDGTEPNTLGRVGSLRFRIAVSIADDGVDATRFEEPPSTDLLVVLSRIRLRFEEGRPSRYARVELTTTAGERHALRSEQRDVPEIDVERWLDDGARGVIRDDQRRRLVDLVANLENVRDVSEITNCLAPDRGQEASEADGRRLDKKHRRPSGRPARTPTEGATNHE